MELPTQGGSNSTTSGLVLGLRLVDILTDVSTVYPQSSTKIQLSYLIVNQTVRLLI
jgi:hypothetical protein